MRWFEGDIAQAVHQSRTRNAVFVVFVEGKDELTHRITSAINDPDVSSKLEGTNFVSIHFESGTQIFNQFSQIYLNPQVPSLYFIGRNGSPIEIVTEVSDSKDLLEKIVRVESIHLGKANAAASAQSTVSAGVSQVASSASPSASSKSEDDKGDVPEEDALENRVERAKVLLEEKRMKQKIKEEEESRQKELQRRKEGQNVQELRRWQQEQELKQFKEERLKEKRMEKEARQLVLEQIAADRAARKSKSNDSASTSSEPRAAAVLPASVSSSNEARLQFRLPDGSTHSSRFSAEATLADVRQYILLNISLPSRNFKMATSFPRREFTIEEDSNTLRSLLLVPSSVILIIPAGSSSGPVQAQGLMSFVTSLVTYTLYPIRSLFSFMRTFIFGASHTNQGPSSGAAPVQNPANTQPEKRSQRRSGGAYRKAANSNIHRLHQNHSSSDDENNTWNGNSTQQM